MIGHHHDQDAPVVMRCAGKGCEQYLSARPQHLANLLAGGPWRCPSHQPKEIQPC